MKIGIIIPWREQPSRIKPFELVVAWYKKHYPEANMYFPDYPSDKWLPSHTRNLGVRMAEEDDCDLIIMNDADTIPMFHSLQKTVEEAYEDNYIHNPYFAYIQLSERSSKEYLNNLGTDLGDWDGLHIVNSNAGTWVFRPETWWSIGGMDEKFTEWGYEDSALEHAHEVIKGIKFKKHIGKVYALQHDLQPNIVRSAEINEKIYRQYLDIFDKDQMLRFVKLKNA
jgi:hypothetical protein